MALQKRLISKSISHHNILPNASKYQSWADDDNAEVIQEENLCERFGEEILACIESLSSAEVNMMWIRI